MNTESINERINPFGREPHNPVLRWKSGAARETICLESGLIEADSELDNELDYSDPYGIWGDDGSPTMLDDPMTDAEWASLLDAVEIR